MPQYTCIIDYFATGEGQRCWMAILSADNEEHAKQGFRQLFPHFTDQESWEFYSKGLLIKEGLIENWLIGLKPEVIQWMKIFKQSPLFCWHFDINES